MKTKSYSQLQTVMNSIRVIMIPPRTSRLSLLVYLLEINLNGQKQQSRNEHEAPTPHLFYRVASETFNIGNICFSIKIALAAPKIIYLDTYKIYFNALYYGHSIKGNNKYSERTGKIASSVLKLYSSYTGPWLLAEFSRIG